MTNLRLLTALLTVILLPALSLGQTRAPKRGERLDNKALEFAVVESGEEVFIRSPIQSVVVSLANEGTVVKKGDLIARLDASAIEDKLNEQTIEYANAKSGVIEAEAGVEQAKLQSEAESNRFELMLNVSRLALDKFSGKNGEYEVRQRVSQGKLELARARLKTSESLRNLAKTDPDAKPGEAIKASFAVLEAQTLLAEAEAELKLLTGPVKAHDEALLKLAVVDNQMRLASAKATARGATIGAKAQLESRKVALQSAQRKMRQVEQQLESCFIRAPQDGIVMYAAPSGRTAATIEEGASVRERQTILRVVNPNVLRLRVSVHESRIARVKVGQPVKIRVDAFPGRMFKGKVTKTSAQPNPSSWLKSNVKEYTVHVAINEPPNGLRIGLTASAEIDLSE